MKSVSLRLRDYRYHNLVSLALQCIPKQPQLCINFGTTGAGTGGEGGREGEGKDVEDAISYRVSTRE